MICSRGRTTCGDGEILETICHEMVRMMHPEWDHSSGPDVDFHVNAFTGETMIPGAIKLMDRTRNPSSSSFPDSQIKTPSRASPISSP